MPFDNTNISVRSDLVTLLTCAHDLIYLEENWCRGKARSDDGKRYCAVGALTKACMNEKISAAAYQRAWYILIRMAQARTGSTMIGVARYNDHFARHCEVVSLFQDAIAVAEREA